MAARRSPWINERAAQLVRFLAERHGLTLDEEIARDDISDQVDLVAEQMRIGRQAAKYYVTEDYISNLAEHIASIVGSHGDAIRTGEVADLDARRRRRPPFHSR